MVRLYFLLSLSLAAFASIVVTLDGQQKETPTTVQNNKSAMRKIYEEDQKDRSDIAGDARRRDQVRQLVAEGKLQSGEDYYYAAFIFPHGQQPSDYLYTHVLAVTAVNKGLHNAMWLSAATLDRYLHSVRQPQVFGTQFGGLYENRDDQEPYDHQLVSDALRAQWCVTTVSAQKGFSSTRTCPVPDAQYDIK